MDNKFAKDHPIKISRRLSSLGDKWIVSIKGITSGAQIFAVDADNMEIIFELDASRFTPLLENG